MDVLTDTSYDASIAKRGTTIPHIADHNHTSTAHVGDVKAIYTKKLRCKDLGYNSEAETTALVMETTIREDYNSDVYTFYKAGKINQHSIGLSYVTIELALNSQVEEDKAEYEVWQKYYPSIINKDLVDKKGYFWAVSEADIRENSCVLFGANALTPTLSSSEKSDKFDLPAKTEIFSKTKGADMATIEELQAEVIRLSAENTNLKSANALEIKKAVKEEQERILGIMKAAETFEIKGSIEKFIKLNHDVDTCVATFETIKEHTQLANPSPKQEQGSTLDKSNTPDLSQKSGLDGILEGFKNIESAQNLFAGIK
jgi:hypothetical protein